MLFLDPLREQAHVSADAIVTHDHVLTIIAKISGVGVMSPDSLVWLRSRIADHAFESRKASETTEPPYGYKDPHNQERIRDAYARIDRSNASVYDALVELINAELNLQAVTRSIEEASRG